MVLKLIVHNSSEYDQMLHLRIHTLLQPIGVPASYIIRENESNDILIGAFEENEIIGCCVLSPKNDQVLQLRQMAVRKDYQGKHTGSAIVCFAEKTAKEKGYRIIMMHARDAVLDFYSKCGYQIDGDQFFEVGIAHHRMKKSLEDNN